MFHGRELSLGPIPVFGNLGITTVEVTTTVDVGAEVTTTIGVDVGAGVGAGVTTMTGVDVGVDAGVDTTTTAVDVAVGVGAGAGGVTQTALVIVLESKVTAPFRANTPPVTFAPVLSVIELNARIFPFKVEFTPRVAELPTCQKILHDCAP